MVEQGDQIPFTFCPSLAGNEGWLLESHGGPGEVYIFEAELLWWPITTIGCLRGGSTVAVGVGGDSQRPVMDILIGPGVMPEAVEQSASRRSALCKVIRTSRVDDGLPEVSVRLGHVAVIDAGELAVGEPRDRWLDALIRHVHVSCLCGSHRFLGFRVKDPSDGGRGELVPLGDAVARRDVGVGREEEEDVAVGDGQVEGDLPRGKLVTACHVAMEPLFSEEEMKKLAAAALRVGSTQLSSERNTRCRRYVVQHDTTSCVYNNNNKNNLIPRN